ncbi:MAG TPA: ABC transporter substrate-binding protein [Methanofollis liminatans]|uniref:ABC transporter substrate-binding protein n=1 Tax=Methanofollis liminatans TaxID=2201 RepID=A0A831LZL8_9EURY|nr:ABC transporter substrate-binding protein [Methanofollis liminatans]
MRCAGYATVIVFLLALVIAPAATAAVPTTPEEVQAVAGDVLAEEIISFMEAEHCGGTGDHLSRADLQDAALNYPEYPRRIVDSTGKTITIVRPLTRIVAYNSHWVTPLHQEDKIVGVANSAVRAAVINPYALGKINIGGGGPTFPDIEKIYECDPDAIITYVTLGPGDDFFVDKMPPSVKVIRMDFLEPSYLREEILKIGYLLDCEEEAARYVAWHDRYVDEIKERTAAIPDDERIRVFIDVGASGGADRRTASEGQYMHTHCTDAGGINVAADTVEAKTGVVNTEWIAQQNPDAILGLCYAGGYETDDPAELADHYSDLLGQKILTFTPAVKNNKVYIISYRYAYGLQYPAALATIAKWFYPDRFADLDPEAINQEYIDRFHGVDYDVTEQGVFTYPDRR